MLILFSDLALASEVTISMKQYGRKVSSSDKSRSEMTRDKSVALQHTTTSTPAPLPRTALSGSSPSEAIPDLYETQ